MPELLADVMAMVAVVAVISLVTVAYWLVVMAVIQFVEKFTDYLARKKKKKQK